MKFAFLFPGQGSQYPEMLHDLPNVPVIQETLIEAQDVLHTSISTLHSAEALETTKAVQLCLLIAGVASFRRFEKDGIFPQYVAGHSVGAFAAATAAGVCTFKQALEIVALRGELMEQSMDIRYGMGVVVGLSEEQLSLVAEMFTTPEEPVYVSNRNAPKQITLSGSKKGIEKVLNYVKGKGASSAKLLNVQTPSHCILFEHVKDALQEKMETMEFNKPKWPISANRTARLLRQQQAVKNDLAESICHPVRWHDTTTILYENGVRLFIEMPPGNVLQKLTTTAFPEATAVSLQSKSYEDCLYLINEGV